MVKVLKDKLKILSELTKIKITSFVTLTTAFGFIAAAHEINLNIIPVLLGILFMACGSAAINHYQEKDFDALMNRTKNRPNKKQTDSFRQNQTNKCIINCRCLDHCRVCYLDNRKWNSCFWICCT